MTTLFWLATFLLLISAFGFVLPRLCSIRDSVFIFLMVALLTYGLYFKLGNSQYLPTYYSQDEQLLRLKQIEFRQLLAEFRKEEFRLKLRLEEDPNDLDAEWRLLDLLAIKSLQNGDKAQALQYWEKALVKMPDEFKSQWRDKISYFIQRK